MEIGFVVWRSKLRVFNINCHRICFVTCIKIRRRFNLRETCVIALGEHTYSPFPLVGNLQVYMWLISNDLEEYAEEFSTRNIDGKQLLNLDGSKLKVI